MRYNIYRSALFYNDPKKSAFIFYYSYEIQLIQYWSTFVLMGP
jgi:hypothetical protein